MRRSVGQDTTDKIMSFINISRGPGGKIRFDSELPKAPEPKVKNRQGDSFKMVRADAVRDYQHLVKPAGLSPVDDILANLDQLDPGRTPSKPNRRA